jgi:transcriptional regulator with XRE-family HTH domain
MGPNMSDEFESKEYRDAFVEANIHTGIAFQIRALRKKAEWSQSELGEKCGGKAQNVISRLEDPDYGKFSLSTLLALAKAFDVALLVKFVPFCTLRASLGNLSEEALAVPNFTEEKELLAASTTEAAIINFYTNSGVAAVENVRSRINFGLAETFSSESLIDPKSFNSYMPLEAE